MKEKKFSEHPFLTALGAQGISAEDLLPLIQTLDESPYSIEEWNEAWMIFNQWCVDENRPLSAKQKFAYISCCAESAKAGVALPLAFLLKEFLCTNGVE